MQASLAAPFQSLATFETITSHKIVSTEPVNLSFRGFLGKSIRLKFRYDHMIEKDETFATSKSQRRSFYRQKRSFLLLNYHEILNNMW
jgi:hypothetical protein